MSHFIKWKKNSIAMDTFIGLPDVFYKGYTMAGYTTTQVSEIQDITFSSDKCSTLTATIHEQRYRGTGCSSTTKGYHMGGYFGLKADDIDALVFSSETCSKLSELLYENKYSAAGIDSTVYGYLMGGDDDDGYTASIDYFYFPTEQASRIGATLGSARLGPVGVHSELKGYALGGTDGISRNYIDDLVIADQTSVTLLETLDTAGYGTDSGFNSDTKGYIMSLTGTATAIQDFVFSTEIISTLVSVLVESHWRGPGVFSNSKGYTLGGQTSSGVSSMVHSLSFSDDSVENINSILDTAKFESVGVQSTQINY